MGGSWATRPVKRRQASCGAISAAQSHGAISTVRSRGAILSARLGLGRWSDGLFVLLAHSLFLLFLSLSLGVCESENHLKVKQKRK